MGLGGKSLGFGLVGFGHSIAWRRLWLQRGWGLGLPGVGPGVAGSLEWCGEAPVWGGSSVGEFGGTGVA